MMDLLPVTEFIRYDEYTALTGGGTIYNIVVNTHCEQERRLVWKWREN
jgi:hypothetical protein